MPSLISFLSQFDTFEEVERAQAPEHLRNLMVATFGHLTLTEAKAEVRTLWESTR